MEVTDLHAHVLPGVDDGPEDIEATIELLRAAWRQGVRTIVATPHMFSAPFDNNDSWFMGRVYYDLLEQLDRIGRQEELSFLEEMRIFLGAENLYGPRFLEALEEGKVLALKDSKYLLLEFQLRVSADEAVDGVKRVLDKGYLPVLAHIERYPSLIASPTPLAELREMGCRTQVNAGSLVGFWPNSRRRRLMELIRGGQVDLVASDAHGVGTRPPRFAQAAKTLGRALPPERVAALLHGEASRILGLAG